MIDKQYLVRFPLYALMALSLAACGVSEAPKCDDIKIQDAVKEMIRKPMLGVQQKDSGMSYMYADGKRKEFDYTLDLIKTKGIFDFTFNNISERSYDIYIRKRFCMADIDGNLSQSAVAQSITLNSKTNKNSYLSNIELVQAKERIAELIFNQIKESVVWSGPQRYTSQLSYSGVIYVSINE